MSDVTISLGPDGQLQLFVPGVDSEGHHVNVPISVEGLRIIRKVLTARSRPQKIGEDGAPTQWQVDAWLRAEAERKLEAQRKLGIEAQQLLEDLGL